MSPWSLRHIRRICHERRVYHGHRGVACVEMAVIAPVVVTLLLGMWEIGRLAEAQQLLSNAVREGGRQASTGELTNTEVAQVVQQYVKHAGLPTQHLVISVENLTTTNADAAEAAQLDRLQVTATLPFADVRWSAALLTTGDSTNLKATSNWRSTKDLSYPNNISAPPGY